MLRLHSVVAQGMVQHAQVVVEAEIFPKIFVCLSDQDAIVRKNAATCIREIAKHTAEVCCVHASWFCLNLLRCDSACEHHCQDGRPHCGDRIHQELQGRCSSAWYAS